MREDHASNPRFTSCRTPRFFKTYRSIRERFTSKGLEGNVLTYVQECNTCQRNKVEHTHLAELL